MFYMVFIWKYILIFIFGNMNLCIPTIIQSVQQIIEEVLYICPFSMHFFIQRLHFFLFSDGKYFSEYGV